MLKIGILLYKRGKLDESKARLVEALNIYNKVYGAIDHHEIAKTIFYMGIVMKKRGNFNESKANFREAFNMYNKVYGTINHPDVARTIHQIGLVSEETR